nr:hypothetical protein [Kofleriaceae bacterium]
MRHYLTFAFAALIACGPGARHGGGDDTGDGGSGGSGGSGAMTCTSNCTAVTGKVYAPMWAPGQVPTGQEIPIFGALVYASSTPPTPIPDHTYCESCVDTPSNAVTTDHDGSFTLNVNPGTYYLVIQKGQFMLTQMVTFSGSTMALPAQDTTLPSKWDPANGAYIPKVAVVQGNYDAVEDILAKIGFGTLSGDKMGSDVGEGGVQEVTFYQWDDTGNTSAKYLLENVSEMEKYHIIFFPCSTDVDDGELASETVLQNIRQFVKDGGKLYVTDWSGETADRAFPPQLQLGDDSGFDDEIDSTGTYDPSTLAGTLTTPGTADGDEYDATDGKAIDPDLEAWLGLQIGPTEDDPTPQQYNPDQFTVVDNWNYIEKMNPVMKGMDGSGNPVYDEPKAWLTATDPNVSIGPKPVAVTYEPTGCGKVLYSTFQTSGADASESHAGLMPQERVLLFLIMEISACTQNPIIE